MDPSTLTQEQRETLLSLAKSLVSFNLKAKITDISVGPVVTGYYLTLLGSTQITNIYARREDIALALGVDSVVMSRSGQFLILYIPNKTRQVIDFKDYLHWYMHDEVVSMTDLPIPLGITPAGTKSVLSLSSCPHILIAGQTGAGKSVLESAILTCLVARYNSEQLKLCLVDTKQVDLPLFADLPHVVSVAKDTTQYFKIARNLYNLTKTRLKSFNNAGVRNINEYVAKTSQPLPYYVFMIDEFASLVDEDNANRMGLTAQKRRETPTVSSELKTLAQISRAAGIFIIAGTQRSSVKIINGDIKVNFPCRIGLRMPSQIDSRTILDEAGAENLLGQGDMLVKHPATSILQRYHGPFVNLSDIEYIVKNLTDVRQFL